MIIIKIIFNLVLIMPMSLLSGFIGKIILEAFRNDYLSIPVSKNDLLEILQHYEIVFQPDFLSFD